MTQPPEHRSPDGKPVSGDETVLLPGGQPFQGQQPPYARPPQQAYAPPPQQQPYAQPSGDGQRHGHGQPPPQQAYGQQQQAYGQQQGYAQQQGYGHQQQGYAQQQAYGQHQHGSGGSTSQPGNANAPTKVGGAAKAIAGLMLLAAVAAGIGSVTEWVDAGVVTKNGLDGDGVITLPLAVVAGLFALVRLAGRLPTTAAIIGLVCGLLLALIGYVDVADVQDNGFEPSYGLWLVLGSGVALAVLSLVGVVKRR